MPKKKNFLGGMQNYNPNNGEYESRLTKADGTPATKENMPGGSKRKFSKFKKETPPEEDKPSIVGESAIFSDLKEGDYYNVASGGRLSYGFIERQLAPLKEKLGEEGWNSIKDDKHFIEGYLIGDYDVEDIVNQVKSKTNKEPREGATHEYLSEEYLEDFYERTGGDEEKMLSLIRDDAQHQEFNNKSPESGWSMNEIQGVVEAFVSGKQQEKDFEDDNTDEIVSKAEKAVGGNVLDSKENLEDAKRWLVSKGYAKSHLEAQDLIESTLSDEGKDKLTKLLGFDDKDIDNPDDDTFERINNARMGTTPKEQPLSKTIKSQLKQAGIDTKKVSVRHRNAGYSDAIDIEIKDPNIDIQKVREIAQKHESYDRDIATGEILSGGNTYVHVQYDYGLFDKIGEEGRDNALALMKQADNSQGNGIEVDDHVFLFKDGNKYFLSATVQGLDKIGRGTRDIYSPEDLAIKIWKLKKFGHIAR